MNTPRRGLKAAILGFVLLTWAAYSFPIVKATGSSTPKDPVVSPAVTLNDQSRE
jgi:hypothetical protein